MARVMIMAGGTGGHVFPALAVARALREARVDVHWLGTEQGLEARIVPESGFPLHFIKISGWRGKGLRRWLMAPIHLFIAFRQALKIIKKINPDSVLGMGGFASGPGALAAKCLGKRLVIHEQNALPGMTNRYLSKIADQVLEAFPGTFTRKIQALTVGNPIRHEISTLPPPEQRYTDHNEALQLLVLGGSQGALKLNLLVPEALKLSKLSMDVKHQTGEKHVIATQQRYEALGLKAEIQPFIHHMAEAYAWADLVIARSGALTVSELAAVGLGAILIPFPFAVDDHQTYNARHLERLGAAMIIQERDVSAESLAMLLQSLATDKKQLLQMAMNARKLAQPQATARVCSALMENAS